MNKDAVNIIDILKAAITTEQGSDGCQYVLRCRTGTPDNVDNINRASFVGFNSKIFKNLFDLCNGPPRLVLDVDGVTFTLEDLNNIEFTNLQDGQFLMYDLATNKWVNVNSSATASMSTLTDVLYYDNPPLDFDILMYDNVANKWVTTYNSYEFLDRGSEKIQGGETIWWDAVDKKWTVYPGLRRPDETPLDDLSDVAVAGASSGEVLTFDGTNWVNGSGDAYYRHNQSVAASVWSITHNLGKRPSVTVTDSAGNHVEGDVLYIDNNNIQLTFSAGFSGYAELN